MLYLVLIFALWSPTCFEKCHTNAIIIKAIIHVMYTEAYLQVLCVYMYVSMSMCVSQEEFGLADRSPEPLILSAGL